VRRLRRRQPDPDLIATARNVESAYLEWTRQTRAGMRSSRRPGQARHLPAHDDLPDPRADRDAGIFQTEAYIRRMLPFWYAFLDAPDDTEATVAFKAERTANVLTAGKHIAAVLGEQALHTRFGTPEEHADQLSHLLKLMRRPYVLVGIIPAGAQRHAVANIGFWIFDNNAVALETPTAAIKVTRPREIALYATLFDQLHAEAVYGRRARQLITDVLAGL
jgi:hypothetical protein